jgi:hypothetical protein
MPTKRFEMLHLGRRGSVISLAQPEIPLNSVLRPADRGITKCFSVKSKLT